MPGADEEEGLGEDIDPVTYLLAALKEDSKLVAKLTAFASAHPTNMTQVKMAKIHSALINAVAALWRSAAEAEATTFDDVAQVVALIGSALWPSLDPLWVALAAKLYDALGVDSAEDSPDSMRHLGTVNPQLQQFAKVWGTSAELERFLLLRARYMCALLAEALDMKHDSGDHMLPSSTRDHIQKGLAFVTKSLHEVVAIDVTSACQSSWVASWTRILDKAQDMRAETTDQEWKAYAAKLKLKLCQHSAANLSKLIRSEWSDSCPNAMAIADAGGIDVAVQDMNKVALLDMLLEMRLALARKEEQELMEKWKAVEASIFKPTAADTDDITAAIEKGVNDAHAECQQADAAAGRPESNAKYTLLTAARAGLPKPCHATLFGTQDGWFADAVLKHATLFLAQDYLTACRDSGLEHVYFKPARQTTASAPEGAKGPAMLKISRLYSDFADRNMKLVMVGQFSMAQNGAGTGHSAVFRGFPS